MSVGDRIREVRKANGLTMEEFGAKIGIVKSSISTIESGKINPSPQTLLSISREFGVNLEWLRDGTGDKMPPPATLSEELADFFADLAMEESFRTRFVAMLARVPPEHWVLLESYARQLLDEREKKGGGP